MCHSEIAQIRQRITEEYEAMRRGLTGFASGTAQHTFIQTRMHHVDGYYDQLRQQLGEQQANEIVYDLYTQAIG